MKEVEVGRVKDFSEGNVRCIKCGREFLLFWNGGELDEERCCGATYRTEHQATDLVIYKNI